MDIFYKNDNVEIHNDNCLNILKTMPDNCIDSVITDPPYFLEFMNRNWDKSLPPIEIWKELLRVAKPGCIMMAFGATRTFHRLACLIEDAGWNIDDCFSWVYGSGMPKGQNISKAMDKKFGAERKVVGKYTPPNGQKWDLKQDKNPDVEHAEPTFTSSGTRKLDITEPATDLAKKWNGWNTGVKPAWEPIIVASKPYEGTYVNNAIKWGVAGYNIDECRIKLQENGEDPRLNGKGSWKTDKAAKKVYSGGYAGEQIASSPLGRYPSNFIMEHHPECKCVGTKRVKSDGHYSYKIPDDGGVYELGMKSLKDEGNKNADENGMETVEDYICHEDCPIKMMNKQSGLLKSGNNCIRTKDGSFIEHARGKAGDVQTSYGDSGGASRFFYCAKASGEDKWFYCDICNDAFSSKKEKEHIHDKTDTEHLIYHPTVKPLEIMKYLAKLTKTPDGGIVLDPFMGSGSTGLACIKTKRKFIGIEMDEKSCSIAKRRLESCATNDNSLF